VFMFSGQGSQYAKMGRGLYETEPVFRQECDRCWQLLEPHLKLDWLSLSDEQLQQTAIAQPALFVIEYALAKLWMSWGVRPTAAIGHSIGEYAAATLAGVFSLEDALMLVATRGRLMQEMPGGAMLSVNLPASEVTSLLAETGIPDLELAVNNAPSLSAISGTFEAVEKLENLLAAREIFCRRLHTSHGFHSQSMEGAIAPFTEAVKKVELNPPQMPFVSNVTGTWILPEEAIAPIYWARHLRQPVRFSDGMAELLKVPERVFLEVGPGRALATLARRQGGDRVILSSLPHPQDKRSDTELLANTLGQLWLKGVNIDWTNFSAEQHRVPLPTYPFERQRYWIEPTEIKTQIPTTVKTEKKADIGDWFYVPSWKREILPAADFTNQKLWLVFVDDSDFCADFCKKLSGVEVIRVKAGSQYEQIDRNFYAINPANREDYDSLFKEVCRGDKVVAIAHLWTLKKSASLAESQTLGFYSLLDIARAFGSLNGKNSLEINVISSQVQKVVGSEEVSPEKATVLGACQVLPQEFFKLNCRHIDVELSETQTDERHKLIDRLIIELTANSSSPIIAYRGGRRWVETFEPIKLEKVSGTKRLREKGVYLITGGMGGIGLAIAEYLASTVRAKLVLIGRSDFPPKSEWQGLLKTWETFLKGKGETNEAIAKIKQLQKLEELGAEVLIVKADVADKQQMQNAVNRVREQFGDIHGVIHAAGVVGKNDIQTKTIEAVEAVFAPKIKGTLVLAEIFKDSRLDFLVFWSSISSIIGGIGQIDYAAANAFLDKFASCQTDGFTMSVNWDIWKEVGMAANVKVPEEYRKRHEENLKQTIATKEGIEAFNRILNGDKLELNYCSQVAVSTIDFQLRIEQSRNLNASEVKHKIEHNGGSQSSHSRPHLGNAFVAPRNELEEKVAKIWEESIGIDKVGVYDNFFELGGHSLLATQVNSRLQEIMPVEVSMQDFLGAPTVAGICEKIEENQAGGDELNSQKIVAVSREAYRQLTISN
ncbi:MAG: SDR family NAD(P)-dependent oxidoreductase, partial [Okeania sp. SIO2H7]|nr:SDR family NAD(P)-dependent oxidoreductase [Okeania sp. SIO2H7]